MQVRNASPEDVNRSSLGRMAGGIALLWLASYAIGIPIKYGLAGALLAISALLFAEWDQGNRAPPRQDALWHHCESPSPLLTWKLCRSRSARLSSEAALQVTLLSAG